MHAALRAQVASRWQFGSLAFLGAECLGLRCWRPASAVGFSMGEDGAKAGTIGGGSGALSSPVRRSVADVTP